MSTHTVAEDIHTVAEDTHTVVHTEDHMGINDTLENNFCLQDDNDVALERIRNMKKMKNKSFCF